MGEYIPSSTLLLEKQILDVAQTKTIISRKEFAEIGSSCQINDDNELSRAAQTLHALGVVVNFERDPKVGFLLCFFF